MHDARHTRAQRANDKATRRMQCNFGIRAGSGERFESKSPARSRDLTHDRLCDVIWARSRKGQTLSRGQDGEVSIEEKQTSVSRRAVMRLCEGGLIRGLQS